MVEKIKIPGEIWILVVAAFFIALGYGFISPILPQFVISFGVGVAAASAVISIFGFSRLIFAPMSGKLVDRLGARWVYITGLLVVAVTTALVALAQSYWHIVVLRGLAGFGSTMFTVSAMGLIVKLAPAQIRGRCSSAYASGFLLGSVLGPAFGSFLSVLGFRWPFVIYGGFLAIAAAVVWLRMPVTIGAPSLGDGREVFGFSEAWSDRTYRTMLVSAFANGWVNFGVRVAIVPLFIAATVDKPGVVAGVVLSAYALGNAVTLQFSGRLTDRVGRKKPIIGGLLVSAVFTSVFGLSDNLVLMVTFAILAGIGSGMYNPAIQALLADIVGADRNGGKPLAAYQMAGDLGAIMGPLLIGFAVQLWGFAVAFAGTSVVLFLSAGLWLTARETWVRQ
ncbi:arabinose efflux permease family protein [Corynebacterium mustelae]|uniref:Arabinose efflux permease family protein n=1 Tax=Corynebacterium mustelae TaxID=571915 RepID=A0A0G3H151_9CORY|nr:MFS transporter [Corynebacterium mustelae]AKK05573.1 arabinose efflux permease family protein [Corynebacterium mustelae]